MKSILFILFFCKVVCYAQAVVIDGIYVDSLVLNVKYAEANLLKVQDKYALIATLLKYEGNVEINPTWPIDFHPINPLVNAEAHPRPTKTTNQAVALYIIEAVLRNNFFFNTPKITYINCFCENKYFPLYSVLSLHIFDFSKERHAKRYKSDLKHFKKIFNIYTKWFKKIKKTKFPFLEAIQKFPSPLPTQHYSWTGEFKTK
jgi:hypothetical protein